MNQRGDVWQRIIAAGIIAAGMGVVWGLGVGWIVGTVASLTRRPRIMEQLNIAVDGTPVISVVSDNAYGDSTLNRRTLDGKPWPNEFELWLGGVYLRRFELPPGVIQFPVGWSDYGERVGGMTDGKKPPTAWYVVSSDKEAERLYFAGYDPLSKRSVGYIGTKGFRVAMPPPDEQFACTANRSGAVTNRVISNQYIERNSLVRYHDLYGYSIPAQWKAFLVDGKRLWEVDLRERTSRIIMEVPDSISMGMLSVLQSIVDSTPTEDSARAKRNTSFRLVAQQLHLFRNDAFSAAVLSSSAADASDASEEPPKTVTVLAIRTRDQVLLYDTSSGRQWQFKLPVQVPPDQTLQAFWVNPETMLLSCQTGYWNGGPITQLYWINPGGAIQRDERLELQGYVSSPKSQELWALSALMPEPLAWFVTVFGVVPFAELQDYKASSYTDALNETIAVSWPMAAIVIVVALAAAWYAHHLHRRYYRQHTALWTTFVFLLGPPGLVTYWLEHRQAKLEACGECGVTVPRNRDACAACNTPFPEPGLVGTEILA